MIKNDYYLKEMQELLKDDYDKFVATFSMPMYKAIRINTLKTNKEFVNKEIEIGEKTPFDNDTYYISEEGKYGKHPYHLAGLYYLQEPSATMVVNALDVKEGDWVLDLCAAPGGKTTHILSKLNNTGFLLTNEYEHNRALTLLSNIERWGCSNYLLTNNSVEQICNKVMGNFDKVVVDAPCSGASMFKKYPESINDYNEAMVLANAKRQLSILDEAYLALKENGTLVYSTCTYNKFEDELTVSNFLANHPDMELVDTNLTCGQAGFDEKGYCRRVFPFNGGEGHFLAKMIKHGQQDRIKIKTLKFSTNKIVDEFLKQNCIDSLNYTIIGDKVYFSKYNLLDIKLNIIRQGILMGEIVKGRFEPHFHFFISYKGFKNIFNITDMKMLNDYLSGLSLFSQGIKGYVQIRYNDIPIGFGKGDNMQIKNKLPKGLRFL